MFIITKRFTRAKAIVSVLLLGVFLSGMILLTGACQRNEEVLPPMGEPMKSASPISQSAAGK